MNSLKCPFLSEYFRLFWNRILAASQLPNASGASKIFLCSKKSLQGAGGWLAWSGQIIITFYISPKWVWVILLWPPFIGLLSEWKIDRYGMKTDGARKWIRTSNCEVSTPPFLIPSNPSIPAPLPLKYFAEPSGPEGASDPKNLCSH